MKMLTRERIEEIVKEALVDRLKVDPKAVTPDADFIDELNADSLGMVDLLIGLEEGFEKELGEKFTIPDPDAEGKTTLRLVADYIEERLSGDSQPAA